MNRMLVVFGCALSLLLASGNGHARDLRTFKFASEGNWTISAVYDGNSFVSCYAGVIYRNGIRVSLIAYQNGNWSLQFYDQSWPDRAVSRFPAALDVDGRTILNASGTYRGRSVFLDIGRSIERVRALMRGRIMSVKSPSGTSRFRLTGSYKAANSVASCWVQQKKRTRQNNAGAFGVPSEGGSGAFAAPATPDSGRASAFNDGQPAARAPRDSRVLSRSGTMEFVVRYLAKSPMRYEILPSGRGYFRNFPVNWRYDDGREGGMMVLTLAQPNAEAGVRMLLADQTKLCAGRSATERKPTTGQPGSRIARASGVCQVDTGLSKLNYIAVEFGASQLALIVEVNRDDTAAKPAAPPARVAPPPRSPRPNDAGLKGFGAGITDETGLSEL